MLPLVVKAAADSASSSVAAASAVSGVETQLRDHTTAVNRMSAALEKFNELEESKQTTVREGRTLFHETVRSVFTPAVVIQLLAIIATGLGLYSQLPSGTSHESLIESGYHGAEQGIGDGPNPSP
jgi:hypothetical protein